MLWWSRLPLGMDKPNWLSKKGFTIGIFYPLEADAPVHSLSSQFSSVQIHKERENRPIGS